MAGTFREVWRLRWRFHLSLAATWIPLGFLVFSTAAAGKRPVLAAACAWWTYELTQFGAVGRYLQLYRLAPPFDFRLWDGMGGTFLVGTPGSSIGGWDHRGRRYHTLIRTPIHSGGPNGRALGFAGAWFFAILAPTSLVPGNRQTVAEHRMYLALVPLVALAVCALYKLTSRGRKGRLAIFSIAGFILATGLAIATVRRNQDYHSPLALWTDTVAKRPLNPFAQNNLGNELQKTGNIEEAIRRFEEAVRLKPDSSEAHS